MSALDDLLDEDFEISLHSISTSDGMLQLLKRAPRVLALRSALIEGAVTSAEVRAFAHLRSQHFIRGERFRYDFAFAAIAVALSALTNAFSREFVDSLARLDVTEMPLAPRVARSLVQERKAAVMNTVQKKPPIAEPLRSLGLALLIPSYREAATGEPETPRVLAAA